MSFCFGHPYLLFKEPTAAIVEVTPLRKKKAKNYKTHQSHFLIVLYVLLFCILYFIHTQVNGTEYSKTDMILIITTDLHNIVQLLCSSCIFIHIKYYMLQYLSQVSIFKTGRRPTI
jgi:hypothetical protein